MVLWEVVLEGPVHHFQYGILMVVVYVLVVWEGVSHSSNKVEEGDIREV